MKILAGVFAFSLAAAPALAQPGNTPPPVPGADAGKPAATPEPEQAPEGTTPVKPAATPEPEEAPEGTTPVKPADTPQS